MRYIIARKRQGTTQIYMNLFQADWTAGEWRDPNNPPDGINFPLEFRTKFHANWVMEDFKKADPDWEYELREYLR